MTYRLQERSLYDEIGSFLTEKLGGKVAREVRLTGTQKQPDIVWQTNGYEVIIEIGIGPPLTSLPDKILQASEYRAIARADGYAVFIYPPLVREYIKDASQIAQVVQTIPFMFYCQAPFLHDFKEKITLPELVTLLEIRLHEPVRAPGIQMVVRTLADNVRALSQLFKRKKGLPREVINEVVGNFDLFSILADAKKLEDEEERAKLESAAADLACYVLVNQLLLYRLLTKPLDIPPIPGITTIDELVRHFEIIRGVDYKAIYNIRVADKFHASIVPEVNKVLQTINLLEPELVPHDLLGRVFHELLPFETRKQLGAFYTKPVAAEILAQIGIPKDAKYVMDPACGTGTLLVAAYRRLRELHPEVTHQELVEEYLTGIDIMPFAAHMTALNLTLQDPLETTDRTRIGLANSLNLLPGAEVRGITGALFKDFDAYAEGVGPDITDEEIEFRLPEKVDVVIMNPPFTRHQRITPGMLGNFQRTYPRGQNYWAYFVAFATTVLNNNGNIAAVLPRDFVRGKFSRIVRQSLLNNGSYSLSFIVKSLRDTAFSEHAAFRDFLVVIQKGKCEQCGTVYLKRSLREMDLDAARAIGREIAQVPLGFSVDKENFSLDWVSQSEVVRGARDLWALVAFHRPSSGSRILSFLNSYLIPNEQTTTLSVERQRNLLIRTGIHPQPPGIRRLLFVTRPFTRERIGRSALVLIDEREEHLIVEVPYSTSLIRIPARSTVPAIKTHAYVPTMSVSKCTDYMVTEDSVAFRKIYQTLSVLKPNFRRNRYLAENYATNLLLTRRFNFTAKGTCFIAFHSNVRVIAPHTFHLLTCPDEYAPALCVWLNSVLSVLQYLILRTETEGPFGNLYINELNDLIIPKSTSELAVKLRKLFEQFATLEFPSLFTQFTERFPAREEMDTEVLKAMGYSEGEAKAIIDELYPIIADELTQMKQAMSGS